MGNLKNKTLKRTSNEDTQTHKLEESELGLLRFLNTTLEYHVFRTQIQSSLLYYIATHRLGYTPGSELQFYHDFRPLDEQGTLSDSVTVTLLPPAQEAKKSPTPLV